MTDEIVRDALERFEESQDGSSFNRDWHEEDTRFARMGDQWPDRVKRDREAEGRPCLTVNRMNSSIRQVVNDARQNKPSIKVSPVDSGGDPDTAEVINGIVRSVERRSNADVAYDTAIDHAVTGGFGFWRLSIDYVSEETFDQEIRVNRIINPLMVHWDTNSTEFDASDWAYGFVSDWLTQEEFERKYPNADSKAAFPGDPRDSSSYWLEDDKIRIAEYFLREVRSEKLLLVGIYDMATQRPIPVPMDADEFKEVKQRAAELGMPEPEVLRERDVEKFHVKRYVLNANEVLNGDGEDWPGSTIPIIPVWGDEVVSEGRRWFRSMIRDARDPQIMYNYWRTASTELVALAPKAPWVVAEGQIAQEDMADWQSSNVRSLAMLKYQPVQGAAMPQRQGFAGVPAGALQEALNASNDIEETTGLFPANRGKPSNETSGRAIMARQREGDTSNFHFIDNLNRAIRYAGQCMVEIIPAVYGPRQAVQILGEDSSEKVVKLAQGGGQLPDGEKLYDLNTGRYDVHVKSGPSYATQREEARETLVEIMRQVPGSAPILGDVLMEHLDFVGADKVAKRLQTLLPQPIQQMESEEAQKQLQNLPPEVQGLIAQGMQRIQQLQAQLKQAQPEMVKAQVEQAKLDLEKSKLGVDANYKAGQLSIDRYEAQTKAGGAIPLDASLPEAVAAATQATAAATQVGQASLQVAQQAQQALETIAQGLMAPKQVIRGPDGRVAGVQPMAPGNSGVMPQ